MPNISTNILQKDHYKVYIGGNCKSGKCSAFTHRGSCGKDWTIGNQECVGGLCTAQPKCSKINPAICDIGSSLEGKDPLVSVDWDKAPNVKCTFNTDNIDSMHQVDAFTKKFGSNKIVMQKYCTQRSENCPKYNTNASVEKGCSKIFSVEDPRCISYYNELKPDDKDAIMQDYCQKNNTEDCSCFNRSLGKAYSQLKTGHPYQDGCWYVPCSNPEKYFVQSAMTTKHCPKQICQTIFNNASKGEISEKEIETLTVCKGNAAVTTTNWQLIAGIAAAFLVVYYMIR